METSSIPSFTAVSTFQNFKNLIFSIDGDQIASGGGDSLVFLWKSNIKDDDEFRPETAADTSRPEIRYRNHVNFRI